MSKHTPGPWYTADDGDEIFIIDSGHSTAQGITSIRLRGAGMNASEAIANARLISAAPDLLEALTEMLEYSGLIEERCDCVATNKARSAIAKATGEH